MTKATCDKIIKTIEVLIVPATAVGSIWGFDIAVYVSAIAGAAIGILNCVKLFLKK